MQSIGWTPITGIDVSRKDHDKSVIAFVQTHPMMLTYACIALSSIDKIRLIDFPAYERERLSETIKGTYGYGNIQRELPRDEECLELKLKVSDILHTTSVLLLNDLHVLGISMASETF